MCCSNDTKPTFKGVMVSTTTSAAPAASTPALSSSRASVAMAMAVLLLASNTASAFTAQEERQGKATAGSPRSYCVFLEGSQELDCVCPDQTNSETEEDFSSLFTPDMISSYVGRDNKSSSSTVASVKLHSCRRLRLHRPDLSSLPRPFYRLRVQDVGRAALTGGLAGLAPGDHVDVWFRNVNGSVVLGGPLRCNECLQRLLSGRNNGSSSSAERPPKPSQVAQVNFHFLDVRNVTLYNFYAGPEVRARVKVRNADGVTITDSFFGVMDANTFEAFNVPLVSVDHSEFHRASPGALALNRVGSVSVADSLLDRAAVDVMSNGTEMSFSCTVAPDEEVESVYGGDSACAAAVGRRMGGAAAAGGGGAAESTGAIALAVVSALLLLAVVGVLYMLHRTGKLEQYI